MTTFFSVNTILFNVTYVLLCIGIQHLDITSRCSSGVATAAIASLFIIIIQNHNAQYSHVRHSPHRDNRRDTRISRYTVAHCSSSRLRFCQIPARCERVSDISKCCDVPWFYRIQGLPMERYLLIQGSSRRCRLEITLCVYGAKLSNSLLIISVYRPSATAN